MRFQTLLFLVILFSSTRLRAQGSNPQPLCGIWYDYDAAGNRIKRYYDCKQPPTPGEVLTPEDPAYAGPGTRRAPGSQSKQEPTVSPNPTSGQFTIRLPKAELTHFHWYDAQGKIITSGNFEGSVYDGTISGFAPGTYLLVVYWNGGSYSFSIVKHQ